MVQYCLPIHHNINENFDKVNQLINHGDLNNERIVELLNEDIINQVKKVIGKIHKSEG